MQVVLLVCALPAAAKIVEHRQRRKGFIMMELTALGC